MSADILATINIRLFAWFHNLLVCGGCEHKANYHVNHRLKDLRCGRIYCNAQLAKGYVLFPENFVLIFHFKMFFFTFHLKACTSSQ